MARLCAALRFSPSPRVPLRADSRRSRLHTTVTSCLTVAAVQLSPRCTWSQLFSCHLESAWTLCGTQVGVIQNSVRGVLPPPGIPGKHDISRTKLHRSVWRNAMRSPSTSKAVRLDVLTNVEPLCNKDIVFYTHTLCPYAQRVMLTLLEKGLDIEVVHVDLSDKPRWYSKKNPRGLVPALEFPLENRVEVESIDLCRLLDEKYQESSLSPPAGSAEYMQMDELIQTCNSVVNSGLAMASGADGRYWGIGTSSSSGSMSRFEASLQQIGTSLQKSGGPYLLGESPTLADLVYMPFMERFDLIAGEFYRLDIGQFCGGDIRHWLDAMQLRPSVQMAAADPELLSGAYRKHMCLDFFDFTTYDSAQLHPQNKKN